MRSARRARSVAGGALSAGLAAYTWRQRQWQRRLNDAEHRAQAALEEGSRGRRTRELLLITDAALATLPLEDLLVELLSRVCQGLPADAAALLLTDGPLDTPVLRAAFGFEPRGEAGTLSPGVGLAARVTDERRALALLEGEVASQVRLTALRDMGAVAGAPLLIGSRVIGALEVGRRETRPYDETDLALLQLAADRTALAIDHARIFERERHIAATLQRSLLPAQLPEIPGVELQSRFLPAGAGQDVGGDFYDVVALSGDRWLLVVGDVCGKGPEAAALTAMVRYTLRAEAAHEPRPGQLLGLLNGTMIAQPGELTFCTLVCVLLERVGGKHMVTIAAGGHPMPLVIRSGGRAQLPPGAAGPLVGVWSDAEFPEHRLSLFGGDALVAYTDGLLEAHAPERILTPEALAAIASDCPLQPLEGFLGALERAALGSGVEPARDDIATLALAVAPVPSPGTDPPGRVVPGVTIDAAADEAQRAEDSPPGAACQAP
ncbi:MAG TPA: GAF domain-containing SpoIIE family protein phosphatase [Solirubrobacteraceae bacterium]|nr:GAF domain-containing SpoIIE family protein phosphatase [Solirubrobacteraceae bacterium]